MQLASKFRKRMLPSLKMQYLLVFGYCSEIKASPGNHPERDLKVSVRSWCSGWSGVLRLKCLRMNQLQRVLSDNPKTKGSIALMHLYSNDLDFKLHLSHDDKHERILMDQANECYCVNVQWFLAVNMNSTETNRFFMISISNKISKRSIIEETQIQFFRSSETNWLSNPTRNQKKVREASLRLKSWKQAVEINKEEVS